MNRDEILAKSVKENSMLDERDKHMRTHRDAFSMWGVIVIGMIIMVIKVYHEKSPSDILSLFFCMIASGSLYLSIKTKKWFHIMITIIFSALTIYYFHSFYAGVV